MRWSSDLAGTLRNVFGIGQRAQLSAEALTAARTFALPDRPGEFVVTGANGNTLLGNSAGFAAEYNAGNLTGTATIDFANGQKQRATLTGNVAITIAAPPGVGHYQLRLIQDATGGRTVTFSGLSASRWLGAIGQPLFNPFQNGETVVSLFWDGTNWTQSAAAVGYSPYQLLGMEPQPYQDLGNVATSASETVTCDLNVSNHFVMSMQSANTTGTLTISFANVPQVAGFEHAWHVTIKRGGRKSAAPVFSPTVTWAAGVQPALQTGSNQCDKLMFYRLGNASIIRGMLVDTGQIF